MQMILANRARLAFSPCKKKKNLAKFSVV